MEHVVNTRPQSAAAVWWAAIRPNTLWAGFTPVLVGAALAYADGGFVMGPAFAALIGALLIQIGTNLFNDYADFKKGADTAARLGPARATQRGWLTPAQVLQGVKLSLGLAFLVGIYLVYVGGWPIVVLGIASLLCAVGYTGGPFPLAYVGLGDVFVMAFFGVGAVCGTYYVQTHTVTLDALVASVAVGALATAILVVNNLRDRHTDKQAGKRTLAVRFGSLFTRIEFVVLVVLAFVLPIMWGIGQGRITWVAAAGAAPMAVVEIRGLVVRDGMDLNRHLGGTARLGLVHGVLLSLGIMSEVWL